MDEALRQHQLWGLAQARISLLTSEQIAPSEVELLECHALEHIDVAWGSGDGGKAWGEMKKVPGKVLHTRP